MNPDESIPSHELSIDDKIRHMAKIGRGLGCIQRRLRNVENTAGIDECFSELIELIDGSWNSDLEMKLDDCMVGLNVVDGEFEYKKNILIDII